jgi:hypothetical protein
MPSPLLTVRNLNVGIQNFRAHSKWRQDFHNRLYSLATAAAKTAATFAVPSTGIYWLAGRHGPTVWNDISHELNYWKALRNGTFTPAALPALANAYAVFGSGLPYAQLPSTWPPPAQIQNLFAAAAALKPTRNISAVFPSKCCHMLLPWEYPVWDNLFSGKPSQAKIMGHLDNWHDLDPSIIRRVRAAVRRGLDYWTYREFLLLSWDTLPAAGQAALQAILDREILAGGAGLVQQPVLPPWDFYPYRTKIPELCLA